MRRAIHFYKADAPYGCFSNFSAHPIQVDGVNWPTSEHYYQAHKFKGPELVDRIRALSSPADAAALGRSCPTMMRADWREVKVAVMRRALASKFSQHPDIRQILLSTGDAILVEHTENDAFWGDGGDGSGLNMLGRLLMEVRSSFQKDLAWSNVAGRK